MFNRSLYKSQALEQLKGSWKPFCLSSLIFIVLVCASSPLLIASAFVSGTLIIAYLRLCLKKISGQEICVKSFLNGIEYFVAGTLGALWFALWTFLWSLLFVIPGIVKAFEYSQMFYILAENPDIGVAKSMRMSRVLTQGHKSDLFLMSLSFLGWAVLASIPAGIGLIWLAPYQNMAFSNAYLALKNEALRSGKLQESDFN